MCVLLRGLVRRFVMSTALADQFNQVLRPYFADITAAQIKEEAALTAFLERYAHDAKLVALLRAAHHDFDALIAHIEQLQQEGATGAEASYKTLAQAIHCYLVRFFGAYLARPLAATMLDTWDSSAILKLYGQRQQILAGYQDLGCFADERGHAFELEQLTRLLIQLLAAQLHTAYQLPGERVLDLNCDLVSLLDILNGGSLKHLKFLASTPSYVTELAQNQWLGRALKLAFEHKAVPRPIEANIVKSILAQVSYQKIFFDAQGRQYVGKVPAGVSPQDFFTTVTLPDLITNQKADVVKLNLTEANLKLLGSAQMGKLYRHGTALAVTTGPELTLTAAPAYARLDTIMGDCALIVALLKLYAEALKASSKHLALHLNWQYEPAWPCQPQLIITTGAEGV